LNQMNKEVYNLSKLSQQCEKKDVLNDDAIYQVALY
jgi:hypothetical protein